jgi:hypothetical protein
VAVKLNAIAEMWEGFLQHAMHPDSHPTQVREMRKAFFSGAYSVLQVCKFIGDTDGLPEEQSCAIIASMADEADAFMRDMKAGPEVTN